MKPLPSRHGQVDPMDAASSRRLGRIAIAFAISAVLLWLALRAAPIDEVARTIETASRRWIAIGLAFYWLEILLRTARWRLLLRDLRPPSFRQVMATIVIGYGANNVLPAKLGELFRADFIGRRYGVSRLSALGTIVVERLLDLVLVLSCAIAGVALMARDDLPGGHPAIDPNVARGIVVVATVVGVAIVVLYLAVSHFPRWKRWVRFAWLQQAIGAVLAGLASVRSARRLASLIALSGFLWTMNGLSMYSLLVSVGIEATPATVLLVIGAAGVAAAIPAAPANLGTLQFAFMLALKPGGYPPSAAFAAASLVQLLLLGSVTLAGAAIYLVTHFLPGPRLSDD